MSEHQHQGAPPQAQQSEPTQDPPKPQGRIVELSGTAHVKLPAGFNPPTA